LSALSDVLNVSYLKIVLQVLFREDSMKRNPLFFGSFDCTAICNEFLY